ncbi:Protein smg homolog [Sterolibacterium denitrificans]|uniref:Protein Smg homolog n=1 Tax=Sterolibacterium denitrificans TaxID=157592 RepID=A0A7Z7HP67_9PROT|nr:DUF494 domain-containing protein [Sterolibacterium denitrificans]SMB22067.1 Protein smg homolog [Sterolibacterium denitrificans]
MFDVLVYLFEMYAQPGVFPASGVLMRKLSAVGFEQKDISAALEWLSGLENLAEEDYRHHRLVGAQDVRPMRIYCEREMARLPAECRGFLGFLEDAGAIDGVLREMIIERAMVLRDPGVPLAKLKIIVLMVLWRRHPAMESLDTLLLEELLSTEDGLPVLH